MDAKPILQSKTFWFNALAGGLAATDYIVGSGVLGPKTTAVAVPAIVTAPAGPSKLAVLVASQPPLPSAHVPLPPAPGAVADQPARPSQ